MISTSEVLSQVDIPRSRLYYLEQKGYVSPLKKRVGEKEYRFYTSEDLSKIRAIWRHLKRGLRYRVAYEVALKDLGNDTGREEGSR